MKNRAVQLSAWGTLAAIVFVTVAPIGLRPADILPVDIDRALAFALLAALFTAAYPRHWRGIGLVLVLAAFGIELLQELSPTRHARIDDAAVKAMGALAGMLAGRMVSRLHSRHTSSVHRPRRSPPMPANDSLTRLEVESRSIECVYFDPTDGRLRIRFRDGRERLFADVPEQEAFAIAMAESPGRYYTDRIKPNFRRIAA
jgi:hypothetical protein